MARGFETGGTWIYPHRRPPSRRVPWGPRRRARCRALIGTFVALAASLVSARAVADAGLRVGVEWGKLGALLQSDEASARPSGPPDADRLASATVPSEPSSRLPWAGHAGRWSLVARDWESARLLMGRMAPTDEVRQGRSKRMVLLRGRFADGPVAPFVQVGLGQWRIDPDVPLLPHDAVSAGQIGAGVELALASWVSLALEADCTLLDPGRLENPQVPPPARLDADLSSRDARWIHPSMLWGSFVAARARF